LSLEAEYGQRETGSVLFWSEAEVPEKLVRLLREVCEADVSLHDLGALPPLAEGLALRTAERRLHHVELVPREWIELQRKKRLMRIATIASIAVLSIWLAVVMITGVVFSVRQAAYRRIRRQAAIYEEPARQAQDAREAMLSLENYSDRSRSALECLREITTALPGGVEISSFTYKKGDSVSLRGTSERTELIYDYFQQLGASGLFTGVKDQPVSTRTIKDRRVSTFSITAELPKEPSGEQP
jgi:Tfp pilus assembly protein PilN